MAAIARLLGKSFAPDRELARFVSGLAEADPGAVANFVGIARAHTVSGDPITGLFLDHHPRLTQASLEDIANAAVRRFAISDALIVHRCGEMAPGEPIVLAAAAAAHRRAALTAVDYMMDRLKSEAVFWKREDGPAGSQWVEPTDQDRKDLSRWSAPCLE
jgi:molybdopterin synthase catalytic subunit